MNECKVCEDLLPLYADGVLNEESAQFVRAHLGACAECRKKYEEMTSSDIPLPAAGAPEAAPLAAVGKKIARRTVAIAAAAVLLCAVIAFCAAFFGVRAHALYPESYRDGTWSDEQFEKEVMPSLTIASGAPNNAEWRNDGMNNSAGDVAVRFALPDDMQPAEQAPHIFVGEDGGYLSFSFEREAEAAWYYPNYELYSLLYSRPARTYVELCRFVLGYSLGEVSVFSSMQDIRIASAVRDLRAVVSVSNSAGKTGAYYPVGGGLDGFIVTPSAEDGVWFVCLERERTLCHILIVDPEGIGASSESVAQFLASVELLV